MEKSLPSNAATTHFQLEFGSTPFFIDPYNRLNTLGFTPFEEAVIIKLRLDCHTKWPAFHWDANALESNARDFQRSEWRVRDLRGRYMEVVVGPKDAATFPRSKLIAVAGVSVTNDSDEASNGVVVDGNAVETISDLSDSSFVTLVDLDRSEKYDGQDEIVLMQSEERTPVGGQDCGASKFEPRHYLHDSGTGDMHQLIYETNPTLKFQSPLSTGAHPIPS